MILNRSVHYTCFFCWFLIFKFIYGRVSFQIGKRLDRRPTWKRKTSRQAPKRSRPARLWLKVAPVQDLKLYYLLCIYFDSMCLYILYTQPCKQHVMCWRLRKKSLVMWRKWGPTGEWHSMRVLLKHIYIYTVDVFELFKFIKFTVCSIDSYYCKENFTTISHTSAFKTHRLFFDWNGTMRGISRTTLSSM